MFQDFDQRSFVFGHVGRFVRHGLVQRRTIQPVLLEEAVQRGQRHADVPRRFDEIEQFVASGLGTGDEKLDDGTGVAWEEFAVGTPGESVLNFADDLTGGELILSRRGRTSDADESRDLCDFPTQLTMEEKMGDDALTGVVVASVLEKGKGSL
jgi:hypothetical protein